MEISGLQAFHRCLFERFIPKPAREQKLLSKTFIYYNNKLVAFICYTRKLNCSCGLQHETATTDYNFKCPLVKI